MASLLESESPEYMTMRKYTKALIQLLKHSIKHLGDTLYANELIPQSLYDEIILCENRESIARRVVNFMTTQVRDEPSKYRLYTKALEEQGQWTHSIVEKMTIHYETELASIANQVTDHDKQLSSDESFHSATSDNDEPSQETKFPYLDASKLSDFKKKEFEKRLETDTRNIIYRFSDFRKATRDSLERRIPLDNIKDTILNLDGFVEGIGAKVLDSSDADKIERAENLSQVFIALCHYVSFFNFRIIEHLVHQYGTADDKRRLKKYCEQLNVFCERNVFEIPAKAFSMPQREAKEFALKCTQDMLTLRDVQRLKDTVNEILGLNYFTLQLCSIREGCVELRFLISAAIADHIFPVSPSQHSALSEIGVRVLAM